MSSSPAILLAFANDWIDDRRHLRALLEESNVISDALTPLVEDGVVSVPSPIHNATVDDVLKIFSKPQYRDRIRIFHFGGHASGSMLMFEDKAGAQTAAHANSLAGYLGKQRGLVLVFLNGCSTEAQVRALRAAGVKAVVATTAAIQDAVAAEFARAFYAELATRSLREAFEIAEHVVRVRSGDDPRAVTRDVEVPYKELAAPRWPWIIDCDPAFEAWTLRAEQPRASWRRRVLVATAAMSLLLVASLIVSAGARRTACRVPGVRSLCAAVGIGDVPTAEEQALWDDALTQDSCDGLRAYLGTYPEGVYTDEAKSRLAGIWTDAKLGPERDARFNLTVNPKRPLPTEEEARRDAQKRGDQDAATMCRPPEGTNLVELRSARSAPRDWKCDEGVHGFMCGFDGDIVCRVRDRIKSEHCRPQRGLAPRESETR